jgi:uncharacterized FAD-dependent dehydrogenase
MIKINQLKLPVGHSQKDLEDKIRKTLRIPSKETFHYEVMRRSLDARKKPSLFYVYCIYVTIRQENSIVKKLHQPSVSLVTETGYRFSEMGQERLNRRPVIVGAGPCGLFAAWQLTLAGYAPLILERGKQVEDRQASRSLQTVKQKGRHRIIVFRFDFRFAGSGRADRPRRFSPPVRATKPPRGRNCRNTCSPRPSASCG